MADEAVPPNVPPDVPPDDSADSGGDEAVRLPADVPYPLLDAVYHRVAQRVHEVVAPKWGSDHADDVVSLLQHRIMTRREWQPDCLTQPEDIKPFVEKIIKNGVSDLEEAQSHKEACEVELDEKIIEGLSSDPDLEAYHREMAPIVDAALKDVPPELRIPLLMSREHNMTDEEVAVAMRCSVPTVRRRIAQGRLALSAALEERGLTGDLARRFLTNRPPDSEPEQGETT